MCVCWVTPNFGKPPLLLKKFIYIKVVINFNSYYNAFKARTTLNDNQGHPCFEITITTHFFNSIDCISEMPVQECEDDPKFASVIEKSLTNLKKEAISIESSSIEKPEDKGKIYVIQHFVRAREFFFICRE